MNEIVLRKGEIIKRRKRGMDRGGKDLKGWGRKEKEEYREGSEETLRNDGEKEIGWKGEKRKNRLKRKGGG